MGNNNLALNKGMTWSLIAGSGIVFADTLMYVLLVCKKKKSYIAMSVVSVGTIVLLSAIQISRYYFMNIGTVWIFRYGFPIMLLWLGIIWVLVLLRDILKWNIWDCIAVFMVMVLIGNYVTKLITGDYVRNDLWSMDNFISNGLGEVIGAALFGMMGRMKKWRR